MTAFLVRIALSIALLFTAGCAGGGTIAPPYTEGELQQRCERTGGWWRPDALMGGYCEFQTSGFI